MDKFIYKGLLEIDPYDCLCCGDEYLLEKISDDIRKGDRVSVRYYISSKEIGEEDANKVLLINSFGGDVESISFVLEAYSEWTIEEYEEIFNVGGHDLYQELSSYKGKYLLLIIEKIKE